MLISDQTVKLVKEIPVTSVLQAEGIPFKKVGSEAAALCPWHNDSNPSLTINDSKNFCYCFVCQTGGDGIGFIRQKFGLSFVEAVERISAKHSIQCTYDEIDPLQAAKEAQIRAEGLQRIKEEQESFRDNLKKPEHQAVRDLLYERQIEPATSREFGLGYAVKGFFSNRLTIPIHDHRNALVGFSGRATQDGQMPKYKNSENNEFFEKSKILFNEYQASQYIKQSNSVIFVEGYFDVISLWQHGFKNAVAMQGTAAPSESILKRLAQKTNQFILCYDADEGGNKAIDQFIKSARSMACSGQINISIATLPAGTDPDQCLREDIVNIASVIGNATPWIDWQIDKWSIGLDRSNPAEFTKVEKQIRQLVDEVDSPALRQYYVDKASKLLAPNQKGANKLAKEWGSRSRNIQSKKKWIPPSKEDARDTIERRLLRLYIHYPSLRQQCNDMFAFIQLPLNLWLKERILEVEQFSIEFDVNILKALLAVSDQHYVRTLRPLLMPTIKMKEDLAILDHIKAYFSTQDVSL